jgi:two-component system KDP operon response regulator KdpE
MQRRILFIEDHDDTRELVKFVLESSGYSVTSDATVAAGLRLANASKFDLCLIDNWLPDGAGVELCEQIRAFDSLTPVLFYSGATLDSDKLSAMQAGAQGYLEKPCPVAGLLRTVAILIAQADQRARLEVHALVA